MKFQGMIQPPVFTNPYIIQMAEGISEETMRLMNYIPELRSISFDIAYNEIIYPNYEIGLVEDQDLGYDSNNEKILGWFDAFENVAYIDASLKNDPRRTFTCWHEVGGHAILQGDWLRSELRRLNSKSHIITTQRCLDVHTTNILERQANLFAAHASAPKSLLYFALNDLLELTRPIRYTGPGKYSLVFHRQNKFFYVESLNDLCKILARQIQQRFGSLSIESLSYRIEELPIIHDVTRQTIRLHRTHKSHVPTFVYDETDSQILIPVLL